MGGACVGVEDGDPAGACKAAAAVFCVSSGVEAALAVSLIQCRWCPSLVLVSLSVPIFSLSFFPSNKQFYPDVRPMANHSIFLPSLPDMVIEGHVTLHFSSLLASPPPSSPSLDPDPILLPYKRHKSSQSFSFASPHRGIISSDTTNRLLSLSPFLKRILVPLPADWGLVTVPLDLIQT
jgi:hypothetical protein